MKAATILFTLTLGAPVDAQTVLERADEQFLRQLTERRFFALAEEHCLREFARVTDVEDKAIWQLRLCRIYGQHAWFATAANRGGLLNQSIDELAEFLKQHTPSAETEFDLRLQQVATLINSVRISIIQAEAGHLFGLTSRGIHSRVVSKQSVTVNRAIELTEALLKRLEELRVRRDLDPARVRQIRDKSRLSLAELHALRIRVQPVEPNLRDDSDAAKAEELANQIVRSSLDPGLKQHARWLLAELPLVAGSSQEFRLKIGGVEDDGVAASDFTLSAFLEIRNLLQQQEATAALDLAGQTLPRTALQIQQLEWLKLEAVLGLRELATQLDDPDLLQSTAEQFAIQAKALRETNNGVFRDAGETTIRRYELVDEVGSEVANLIEQIDRERSSGDNDQALAQINQSLNRLTASRSPRARAALLLRAGETHIALQDWDAAFQRLQTAEQMFGTIDMPSQQAVSDLLRIFCEGQLWAAATAPEVDHKQRYITSLEHHLVKFADQATALRAREWLLKVVEPDSPYRAAAIAMDLFESGQPHDKQITALLHAGGLLSALNAGAATPEESLIRRFQDNVRVIEANRGHYPSGLVAAVELCDLEFDITAFSANAGKAEDWSEMYSQLSHISAEVIPLESDAVNATNQLRLKLLDAIIAARNSAGEERLQKAGQELQMVSKTATLPVVSFLSRQFGVRQLSVGDIWLARTTQQIISQALQDTTQPAMPEAARQLLPHIVRVTDVTGETTLRSQALQLVLSAPLNDKQLAEVAAAISQSTNVRSNDATLKQFWHEVIKMNKQGTDIWLEASLQLATIASADRKAETLKQLDVIQTLYPDWGTAGRKERALALRESLR